MSVYLMCILIQPIHICTRTIEIHVLFAKSLAILISRLPFKVIMVSCLPLTNNHYHILCTPMRIPVASAPIRELLQINTVAIPLYLMILLRINMANPPIPNI